MESIAPQGRTHDIPALPIRHKGARMASCRILFIVSAMLLLPLVSACRDKAHREARNSSSHQRSQQWRVLSLNGASDKTIQKRYGVPTHILDTSCSRMPQNGYPSDRLPEYDTQWLYVYPRRCVSIYLKDGRCCLAVDEWMDPEVPPDIPRKQVVAPTRRSGYGWSTLPLAGKTPQEIRWLYGTPSSKTEGPFSDERVGIEGVGRAPADARWQYAWPLRSLTVYFRNSSVVGAIEEWSDF